MTPEEEWSENHEQESDQTPFDLGLMDIDLIIEI